MGNSEATQRQSPLDQAKESPVPIRETGVGLNTQHPVSPTDDENTDKRRCHYGDTDRMFGSPARQFEPNELRVNDIPTPNNPTRDKRIQGDNSDTGHETGFGRAMTQ